MKFLAMLVRREFWEHRVLWMAPLTIAGALFVLPMLFGHFTLRGSVNGLPFGMLPGGGVTSPGEGPDFFALTTVGVAVPFFVATAILMVVYLLDCLYAERRDRSILFWKSLPVSDAQTVLSKFLVGMVLVPLATFAAAAITGLLVFGMMSARSQLGDGAEIFGAWLRSQLLMLYGVIAAILWYAPYGAYLMLVSASAKRSVYAWALLPPLLVTILERLILGTSYVGHIVERGLGDFIGFAFRVNRQIDMTIGNVFVPRPEPGDGPGLRALDRLDPGTLLSSPQLWVGLLCAAVMLWLAIEVRRRRDDS